LPALAKELERIERRIEAMNIEIKKIQKFLSRVNFKSVCKANLFSYKPTIKL